MKGILKEILKGLRRCGKGYMLWRGCGVFSNVWYVGILILILVLILVYHDCCPHYFHFTFASSFSLSLSLSPSLSPSFDLCYISTSRKYTSIHHQYCLLLNHLVPYYNHFWVFYPPIFSDLPSLLDLMIISNTTIVLMVRSTPQSPRLRKASYPVFPNISIKENSSPFPPKL